MINLVKVENNFCDYESLVKLNDEAFPIDERTDIDEIIKYAEEGIFDFTAVYDDSIFVGFYVVAKSFNVAYLYYFAIDKNLRSKGYGSQILAKIGEIYANNCIVVDLEVLDDTAKNNVQRIRRHNFYIKNGFKEIGCQLMFNNTKLDLLCFNNFDKENFIKLTEKINNTKFCVKILSI